MATVCLKCGDKGFTVALIYCNKCLEVAEHRYCLDVIPKTFTEHVTWFCEDCDPEDPAKVKIKQLGFRNIIRKGKHSMKLGNKKNKRSGSAITSGMELATADNASVSAPGDKNSHFTQPVDAHSNKDCASDQTHHDGAMDIDNLEVESTKCNDLLCTDFNREVAEQDVDSDSILTIISEMLNPSILVSSQPIFEPVWRGCFKLRVGEFGILDGLAAHLSTKASMQVYEEAQLLPGSLCPELLPRFDIWPKGFMDSGPKDENIGLYFFHHNESDEKQYESLVNHMIEYNLAMRAAGANADLLIFTSMELPLKNWRFQSKYYLWGVFRGKEASKSREKNQALTCEGNTTTTPETAAENENLKKCHLRRSPHGPLSNSSSHESDS